MRKVYKVAGFTLIELIVVIVLLGVIAAMGGRLLNRAFSGANKFNASNDPNYWQGVVAYERMVRDLREMVSLSSASVNSITYVDQNGNTTTYSLSGSQLIRKVSSASGNVLANNLSSLSFGYYDVNGNAASQTSTVACINVITILTQPNQSGSSLQTLVCPRNFMN